MSSIAGALMAWPALSPLTFFHSYQQNREKQFPIFVKIFDQRNAGLGFIFFSPQKNFGWNEKIILADSRGKDLVFSKIFSDEKKWNKIKTLKIEPPKIGHDLFGQLCTENWSVLIWKITIFHLGKPLVLWLRKFTWWKLRFKFVYIRKRTLPKVVEVINHFAHMSFSTQQIDYGQKLILFCKTQPNDIISFLLTGLQYCNN